MLWLKLIHVSKRGPLNIQSRHSLTAAKIQHLQSVALRWQMMITITSSWARWRLKSLASRLFTQSFFQAPIKENIAPRHWLLWGEFVGDRWILHTKRQECGKCFHLITSSWFFFSRQTRRTANVTGPILKIWNTSARGEWNIESQKVFRFTQFIQHKVRKKCDCLHFYIFIETCGKIIIFHIIYNINI